MKKKVKKRIPKRKKTNVLIVGAGKAGSLLIDLFHKSDTVNIIGVIDKNPHASGIKLAHKLNIPTATHYKKFLRKKKLDEIINVTGSIKVQDELLTCKPPHVEVIGRQSAKLIWELIEERKLIEKALEKSKETFYAICSTAVDAVILMDKKGKILYWNKAAEKIFGYKSKEALGQNLHVFLVSQKYQKDPKKVTKSFKKEGIAPAAGVTSDFSALRKDGSIFPIEVSTSVFEAGGACYYVGIVRNITERKQAEAILQKSEEKFRLAFENARDAIFWANSKTGIIVNCNKAAEALLEKTKDEIIGHHQTTLHPPKQSSNPFKKHATRKFPVDLEAEVITKSGKIKPVIITPSLTVVGGEPIIQGIFHDISNRKVAEETLRQSEEKYRDLYDHAPDMYHTLDEQGIIIDCNETEARMLGYEKDELIGKQITDFFTDNSQELFKNDFPRLNREKRLLNLEREYVRKDGSTFPAMLNVFSEYDKNGNFVQAKTISRDITILKFAEKALKDSEQKYRDLVDNALVGIFQTTIDGDILYGNEALSRMLEFPTQEAMMVESVLMRYKSIGDREVLIKNLRKENKVNSYECDLLTKTGKTVTVLISAMLTNYIISGMIMDITEHKRAEERMTFLAQVLNTSPLSVIATDDHGKIIYVNPATEKLYGYKDNELLGRDPIILNADLDSKSIQKNILKTVRYNKVWTGELLNRKKNGELFYVQDTIYKLIDEKGNFIAFVSFAEDITDRKKLEEQLLQAQKMEAVGQLAGGIAHDFNNILTAIIGYGNLLKTDLPTDTSLALYIQRILTSAQRAANLTRSLLTFSRTQIIHAGPCNLNNIIKGMSELLSRLIGESIELSTILAHEDLTILADSSQIELVLMNLATNAMDAMPDGGNLIIRTERITAENVFLPSYDLEKSRSYALISFEDTGQGIDEQTKERIFEPFYTTKEVGKGTGLGLSMAYGIIKQHDGHIDVYSEPGKGTTFKIYFPLIQPQAEEEELSKSFISKTGDETILVAEDDIQVRDLIKQLLELFGYNIIVAKDGEDAIDIFTKNEDKISLLLLDVIMPKKNGKEVYDEIKKRKPQIKAIFISGYSSDIIHKKGILEEGLDFLSKPILQEILLSKVREVLDR
jgi:two-component system cell cycle sensor histidine kinase/response regulator CckA